MFQSNKSNVVDILVLDHEYLKDCCKVMKGEDKIKKNSYAKPFLDALKKHTEAEEKTVYFPLEKVEELRSMILEGAAEHGVANTKLHHLQARVASMTRVALTEDDEIQFKVLAELLEHHLKEEEKDLFPEIRKVIKKDILNDLGYQFLKARKFTPKDLESYPKYQEQVIELGSANHRISPHLAEKVDKIVHSQLKK